MHAGSAHRRVCGQLKGHPVRISLEPVALGVPPCINADALGEVLDEENASPQAKLVCKVREEHCALDRAIFCTPVCCLHCTLEAILHRKAAILHQTRGSCSVKSQKAGHTSPVPV